MSDPALALRLPGAVRVGEPVRIELVLGNPSDEAVELAVPGRPPAFDLTIETEDGGPVWRRLEGGAVAMALTLVRVEPGGERVFRDAWDGRGASGEPVPPGRYLVRGVLPAEGGELGAGPEPLEILPDL